MTASTVASTEAAEHGLVLPGAPPALPKPRAATGVVAPRRARTSRGVVAGRRLSVAGVAAFLRARWPLIVVLAVVTVLAARMIMLNTAFLDEATYLSAGHVEWQHWLHGGPGAKYSTYFSGSPEIYPVIAAVANAIGGLALARSLSLVFVLVTIVLLYATAKRLFDARTAGWATAVFATVNGTQFLAAFATYDAMALMLMALAVWVSVRFAQSDRELPHAGLFLGVPVLALANASKYATGLFDPVTIAVVALVVAERYGWRQARRTVVMYTAMLAAVLAGAAAVAGHGYAVGILLTTLNRPPGSSTVAQVLGDSASWLGAIAALALLAMATAWWQVRRRPLSDVAAWSGVGLMAVLAVAGLLAPLEQAHVRTTISLNKHVTFGAWFAAIAVGVLLSRLSGRRLRSWLRWSPIVAGVVALGVIGHAQASMMFHRWPNSSQLTANLQPYVAAVRDKPVLMDDSDVARYYLGSDLPPDHWVSTYFLQYQPPGSSTTYLGNSAFVQAIRHDHFGVVALEFGAEADVDRVVQAAIMQNPNYTYLGKVYDHSDYGSGAFMLWIDRHPETSR